MTMDQLAGSRGWQDGSSFSGVGEDLHTLVRRLYPICRSITGNGVRETLEIIKEYTPLHLNEVPSGTRVFDWTVPEEWNIRAAYIKDPQGKKIVDFVRSNLHVLNYSIPVHKKVPLAVLKEHIHTLPEYPEWIPYRTTYYKKTWGFCMSHSQYEQLAEGTYEVYIDSSLEPGHLTYGEILLPGKSEQEVLISTHICHPSLANDNLSGIVLATFLARYMERRSRRFSYRFVFLPATIGAITWLALNQEQTDRIVHGLVLACLGDPGNFTYKRSRQGNAEIDRIVAHVLEHRGRAHRVIDFFPYGYDERQYCSCGMDLPVGCLMRSPHGEYPQYHTSADDLELVRPQALEESFLLLSEILELIDQNRIVVNRYPQCEPQLGKRGLYPQEREEHLAILWTLNLADGEHSLLDIAERSGIPFSRILQAAQRLLVGNVLQDEEILH